LRQVTKLLGLLDNVPQRQEEVTGVACNRKRRPLDHTTFLK